MTDERILIRLEGLKDRVAPVALFGGWPLPDRLAVKTQGVTDERAYQFMTLTPGDPIPEGTDRIYVKTNESQLDKPKDGSIFMRGAQYELRQSFEPKEPV